MAVLRAFVSGFALPVLARRIAPRADGEIETFVTTTAMRRWRAE